MDVIDVLETFGKTVLLDAEITGLTETMIEEFQEAWDRGGKLADVFGQLAEWGIKQDVAERFIKEHDVHTCAVLERNPYAPVESISGYGWKTADTLGITHFGFADDDPRRVQGGLAEAVRLATIADGHTWMTYPDAVIRAGGLLGLDTELIEVVIAESVDTDGLIRAEDRVWPRVLWDAEQTIARGYTQQIEQESLLSQEKIASIERPAGSVLSAEQWDAVMTALSCPISLLTGGPGCGKTTAIRTLIEIAAAQNIGCTLMAPTGKAALRMAEATGVAAKTLHSALGLIPGSSVSRLKEPLSGLVIVDEFSMVDAQMAAALFTSLGRTHLLLVGDPDQLPSVGPGAVLRDMLTVATCPRTHLTRMYRNDAGIAINAAHIRAGERIENLPDCLIMSAQTQETATAKVLDLLIDTLPAMGYERSDVLVLCATNDMRIALNIQLQTVFNSQEAGQGYTVRVDKTHSYELRLGDVVMVSKNNSELGVFNGQIGTVQGITGRSVDVELDGDLVSFTGDDRRTVQLAYAITGHKSQGSEARAVIVPVFQSRVLSKEWTYTVLTRARERAYLIGDPSALQGSLRRSIGNERRTSLVESMRKYDC